MCGRYVLKTPDKLTEVYHTATPYLPFAPNFNITPTSMVPIVFTGERDRQIEMFRWGLVPSWSRGPDNRYSMINARAETVAEKPAFRDAYRKRRCIVPANGFYEWKKTPDGKQPFYITPTDGELFSMAGLCEQWTGDDETIRSFTIITTPANQKMSTVHDRMPAILFGQEVDQWLDPDIQSAEELQALLHTCPEDGIGFYPVSKAVNYPGNRGEELITPLH